MAVTRGGTISSNSRTTTGTDASVTHTVDTDTTLLVVSTMYEAGETVSGTPQWSGNGTPQNLTLVDETTRSGSNNDMCISTYALASPTVETDGTVTVTHSSNDNFITTAVNYLGTNTSATMTENIAFIAEDVNDAATNTTVFSSGGTSGNTLYAAGSFKGGDGDGITVPTNFTELFDGASGTNINSDIAGYVCDYIGGAASACTWTWAATDENAGHYLEIVPGSDTEDALTADNVESASEVTVPAIGQTHVLGAVDVESASEVTAPALTVKPFKVTRMSMHGGITRYTRNFSGKAADTEDNLLAEDVESASEVTIPALGQEHVLLADDVESASEVTVPVIGQEHALLADNVESASEVTVPILAQVHTLLADNVESASEVTVPVIGQVHAILADDVESASEVSVPVIGQIHALLATSVESASELTSPVLVDVGGGTDVLLADDVESASEVSVPAIGQEHALLADNVESASEVSSPAMGQEHALLATSVESASEISAPVLTSGAADNFWVASFWASAFWVAGFWTEGTDTTDNLLADDVESASEVSTPAIGQVHVLTAVSVESGSEVSAPRLNAPIVSTETNAGGWFWGQIESERLERERNKKKRAKAKKKARKLKNKLDRALYLEQRKIEDQEEREAELARLAALVESNRNVIMDLNNDRLTFVMDAALEKQTFSAIERLERELQQERDAQMFHMMATQVLLNQ